MSEQYDFRPIKLKYPEVKSLLARMEDLPRPVMLWGPPGVGKTAVVKEVAEEKGLPLRVFYAAYMEPPDIQGFPVPDREKGVTRYMPPETLDLSGDGGVLFFDEITNARRDVQTVLLEIMREGSVAGKPLTGWHRVAAGNRVEDLAGSNAMISSLRDRLLHVELVPDLDVSSRYWLSQGGDAAPFLVGFLQFRNQAFDMLSPRAWTDALDMLNRFGVEEGLRFVGGIVGMALASDMGAFYALRNELPSAGQVFSDPEGTPLPKGDKPFVMYAMVSYLAEVVCRVAKENPEEARRRFGKALRYLMRSSPMFPAAFIAAVSRSVPSDVRPTLVQVPEYGRFVAEHADILF